MPNALDAHAVKAIELARVEAHDRYFSHVGTESILVGLLQEAQLNRREPRSVWGISVEEVRAAVATRVGSGPVRAATPEDIELTPRAVEVLRWAEDESERLGQAHVRPEFLFLALLEIGTGEGLNSLVALELSVDQLRADLRRWPSASG